MITGHLSSNSTPCSLFTRELFDNLCTCVALDVTAPLKFAVATLTYHNLLGVVASAAAQDRAAVQARAAFITLATVST